MKKYGTISYKVLARIARKNYAVFVREDFEDLGGYDQIGRILRELAQEGRLLKLGYGLYAKTEVSSLTGNRIPVKPLPELAREAVQRLGLKVVPSKAERDYNSGRTTQVPTGRRLAVKGRINRKIGYDGVYVSYEPAPRFLSV